MKKQFNLYIFAALILFSCKYHKSYINENDIIRKNIDSFVLANFNDPKSFEFISITKLDSITFDKNMDEDMDNFNQELKSYTGFIDDQLRYKKTIPSLFDEKDLNENQLKVDKLKKQMHQIDSIKLSMGNNIYKVAAYLYNIKFRAKNAMGALILHSDYMQISNAPKYEILNITDDLEKLYIAPNGYPGREKIFK